MAGLSFFSDLLSENPEVPVWSDIDPTKVQADTVSGNLSTFAAAKELAKQYDANAVAQLQARLKAVFPQFAGLQEQGAKLISDRLNGVLSTSDAAASQRSSAARSLGLGVGGSPFGSGLTLRDLGIKSYQAQSEGMSMLPGFSATVGALTKAPSLDVASMFLSPQQRWQETYDNQVQRWNQQWLANQIAVQPEGIDKALAGFGDYATNQLFTMGGIMGGAAAGAAGRAAATPRNANNGINADYGGELMSGAGGAGAGAGGGSY